MRGHAVLMSTGKDDWATPPALFAALDAEFLFVMDVAANKSNACVGAYFGPDSDVMGWSDALVVPWAITTEGGPCYCNPPYSRGLQGLFISKAASERAYGCTTVMLLPARTDTKAFHNYIWDEHKHQPREGVEVRLLRGRLKFVGAPSSAPFPSMIVIFRGAK